MVIAGPLESDVMAMRSAAVLPAASLAVTVITFVPGCKATLGIDHEIVPVATPLPPLLFDQLTCDTATLSDAEPPSATAADVVENVAPAAGNVMSTAGATPSVRVTVSTSVPISPAASWAVTVITVEPISSAMLATVHAVVPEAMPDAPLSVTQLTCVTPNASLAVPPSANVADDVEKVVPAVGVAIETAGAAPSVIVTVTGALVALPAA